MKKAVATCQIEQRATSEQDSRLYSVQVTTMTHQPLTYLSRVSGKLCCHGWEGGIIIYQNSYNNNNK